MHTHLVHPPLHATQVRPDVHQWENDSHSILSGLSQDQVQPLKAGLVIDAQLPGNHSQLSS